VKFSDCDFCGLLYRCAIQTTSNLHVMPHLIDQVRIKGRRQYRTEIELESSSQPTLLKGLLYEVYERGLAVNQLSKQARTAVRTMERTRLKVGFSIQQLFGGLYEDMMGQLGTTEVVSYDLLRRWKRQCNESHHECQARKSVVDLDLKIAVIDLEDLSLSELPPRCSFVALSYVWGKVDTLKALSSNIADLRRPEGLKQFMHLIPRTIQDAFTLAQGLGERYLWVDSLCIIQDDPSIRDAQIAKMHLIYGLASLTIIAADGFHANTGLPGIREKSRYVPYNTRRAANAVNIQVSHDLTFSGPIERLDSRETKDSLDRRGLGDVPWSKRAWTFQEQMLSSRFLISTEQQLFWQCKESIWCESILDRRLDSTGFCVDPVYIPLNTLRGDRRYALAQDIDRSLEVKRDGRIIVVRSEGFSLYVMCVTLFTPRNIGFDSDILKAFKGYLRSSEPYV
jgi:hypothetical protein